MSIGKTIQDELARMALPWPVKTQLTGASSEDAFSVRLEAGVLRLAGTTPRGLMQAVFEIQDRLAFGLPLEAEGTFHFRQRIFHQHYEGWRATRADVRYIARLGATHCLVSHDWMGERRRMQGYVASPIFPDAVDQGIVADQHAGLRRLLDDCADYGLGAMIWLTELPCQGGPWVPEVQRQRFLSRYPADVLSDSGSYEGKVLCFGHPLVQDYYRDLGRRFFRDFPEIETIFLFGLDSSGRFCDPHSCPRCRGQGLFEQRDRFIRFMIENTGRRVLTTGWEWDRASHEFLLRQAGLPANSGVYLAAQKDGWQCERQDHGFLREVRKICRERGQTFIGYDNFHWGDDTVHGLGDIQDFPLGIGAKLRRWRDLDADGVFDHWGCFNEAIWSNSIACREFFLDPAADMRPIAHRQFGAVAGDLVFLAWQELEKAHVILSDACTWTPWQWPNWYGFRGRLEGDHDLRKTQLPPRDDYNPPGFADAARAVGETWRAAFPHYEAAAQRLRSALDLATDEPVGYSHWYDGAGISRREHIRRQLRFVEAVGLTGREIGLQFGYLAGVERFPEHREACLAAAGFFEKLGQPKGWSEQYARKAQEIAMSKP